MIVRCLSKKRINKMYDGKKIKRDKYDAITVGKDYVVISIEITSRSETSSSMEEMRYWIVDNNGVLIPYDVYNFEIIDGYMSNLWTIFLSENSLLIGYKNLGKRGYICDYFDYKKIEKEYNKIIKKIFKESILAIRKKNIKLKLGISNINHLI